MTEHAPEPGSSTAVAEQRVFYANWFEWAVRTLAVDARGGHAAAQAAMRAMKEGGDAVAAKNAAGVAARDRTRIRRIEEWDPRERNYAEWFGWAVRSEGADSEGAHRAAAAAVAALDAGRSQAEAADAGRARFLRPEETRLVRAAQLERYLKQGGQLQAIENASFHRHPGEYIVASVPAARLEFFGTDEKHSSGWFVAFGNPVLTVATLAGSAVYNAASKAAAQRRAAERWRPVDAGVLHVTNLRLAFQGGRQWFDIPYASIRASGCFIDCLEIAMDERYPLRIQTAEPEWCFVAMRHLSGQAVSVEVTPGLMEKAQRAGITF